MGIHGLFFVVLLLYGVPNAAALFKGSDVVELNSLNYKYSSNPPPPRPLAPYSPAVDGLVVLCPSTLACW